jgi:hypothetical protein
MGEIRPLRPKKALGAKKAPKRSGRSGEIYHRSRQE